MRMKKVFLLILAAAILCGCIFAAGCVDEQSPAVQTGEETPADEAEVGDPAYSVTVTTSGKDTYSKGDIFSLTFVSNPSTGYTWVVTEGKEILYNEFSSSDEQSAIPLVTGALKEQDGDGTLNIVDINGNEPVEEVLVGKAGTQTFWFQPDKAGDYKITLKYLHPWEGEKSAISTYSQMIHVVDSNEPSPDGAKTEYVFDTYQINPAAGEFVKIIKTANPTTGYFWEASGDGLTIIESYVTANPGGAYGSSGQYEWYVTAGNAGDYVFKAVNKFAGSDEELSYFEIPLKFI